MRLISKYGLFASCLLSFPSALRAEIGLGMVVENSVIFEARNEARIPGDGGTLVDLGAARPNPASYVAPRIYASYQISPRHEIRALWAPLQLEGRITRPTSTTFLSESFAASEEITTFYKFNSYRLGYAYRFEEMRGWNIALGFTAKIRDAEIRLSNTEQSASKKNVGFVPLLHAEARRYLSPNWSVNIDMDGLAAPQGRAIDLALSAERFVTNFGAGHVLYAYVGYRTVEGGADNDEVYNFAWFNSAVLGLRGAF